MIASRSPEERTPHCPVCGNQAVLEFYEPPGVALCPRCGLIVRRLHGRLAPFAGLGTSLRNLGADSLDVVEVLLELEEEFGLTIPADAAGRLDTVEDLLRHLRGA
jgi:acyl carrier protein